MSVGVSHGTAQFAVASIRQWWLQMGRAAYPDAKELLITADSGGSNGSRARLWKVALAGLVDELNMTLMVRHLPAGTSKWNKMEHRMFCHITRNWRAKPLIDCMTIIALIRASSTKEGLVIRAEIDPGVHETGITVTDEQLASINIERCSFHSEWNYSIMPSKI